MQKKNKRWRLALVIWLVAVMFTNPLTTEAAEVERSSTLWMQENGEDWAGWRLEGVQNSDNALRLDWNNAKNGTDPYGKNGYNGINYYNGGSYRFGEALAPYYAPVNGFDSAVVSWNAGTPPGTWLAVKLRAMINGQWTKEYVMGVWGNNNTVKSHSLKRESDGFATLETDTLTMKQTAQAFQVRVILFSESNNLPSLQKLTVSTLRNGKIPALAEDRQVWGRDIVVPAKSQMIYPDGGVVWCSPTSLSMVLNYWGQKLNRPDLNLDVPAVVARTFDPIYDGWGNWTFNVAFAGTLGLTAYVTRLHSLAQIESWIQADIPVITSLAYQPGELPNTPITQSDGHLLVIRGFDANGNVITNDPAADPRKGQATRIVYPRRVFENAWLKGSGGTVYIIYPASGYAVPDKKSMGSWFIPNSVRYADKAFEQVWQSTDAEVAGGKSNRSWLWGVKPFTNTRQEVYEQTNGGYRVVQYFDKSRMEISRPDGDRSSKWFVTNGLLTQELVSGRLQTGDTSFSDLTPANIPVAGDPDSSVTPTYAAFANITFLPGKPVRSPNRTGQPVATKLDRNGNQAYIEGVPAVKVAAYSDQTGHNIADVLWSWMNDRNRSGLEDWVFALGLPISEPFWVEAKIGGAAPQLILVQLFERRVLTYNPRNAPQWQVEMGNIGQHYYRWRYR
jgi:hypothetical protein